MEIKERFHQKLKLITEITKWCDTHSVTPTQNNIALFKELHLAIPKSRLTMTELLRRPKVSWETLFKVFHHDVKNTTPPQEFLVYTHSIMKEALEQVATDTKYAGYLERDRRKAIQREKLDSILFPQNFNFYIDSISTEVAERLHQAQPRTLGAASRLPGITPAAIDALTVYIARHRRIESIKQ